MAKRASDLSLEELAAMGSEAALEAAQTAYDAGLNVAGTVDLHIEDRIARVLVERRPSGTVSAIVGAATDGQINSGVSKGGRPEVGKAAG